ncbi:MAG: fibronectin type III domain-containing protein [Propionibacteriaceae bacterium]|jgi:hypothetical protein|nr:fibronectin type III domain-containing protein [Propionibacteriaceae bacterium]
MKRSLTTATLTFALTAGLLAAAPPAQAGEFPPGELNWTNTQRMLKVDFHVRDTIYQEYRLHLAEGTDRRKSKVVDRKLYRSLTADYFTWDSMEVWGLKDNTTYTAWLAEGDPKQAYTVSAVNTFTTPKWEVFAETASVSGSVIEVYPKWHATDNPPGGANIFVSSKSDKSDRTYSGHLAAGGWRHLITGLAPQTLYYIDVQFGDNTWWSGVRYTATAESSGVSAKDNSNGSTTVTFGSVKGVTGNILLYLTPAGSQESRYVGKVANKADGGNVSYNIKAADGGTLTGVISVGGRMYTIGSAPVQATAEKKPKITSLAFGRFVKMRSDLNCHGYHWVTDDNGKKRLVQDDESHVCGYSEVILPAKVTFTTSFTAAQIDRVTIRYYGWSTSSKGWRAIGSTEVGANGLFWPISVSASKGPKLKMYVEVHLKDAAAKANGSSIWSSAAWTMSNPAYLAPSADCGFYIYSHVEPWMTYEGKMTQLEDGPAHDCPAVSASAEGKSTIKAPKSLKASKPGPGSVTLTWKDGQKDVSTQVFAATASGGPWKYVGGTSGTKLKVSGLTPGTKYYFKAVHYQGTKATSSTAKTSVTTTSTTPTKVAVGKKPGVNKLELSWQTSYTGAAKKSAKTAIYVATAKGGPYRYAKTVKGQSATVTGLPAGVTHYFRLQDVTKPASPSKLSKIVSGVPKFSEQAPTLKAKAKGAGQVSVTFAPAAKLSGAQAVLLFYADSSSRYVYWGSLGAKGATKTVNIPVQGAVSLFAVVGIDDGVATSTLSNFATATVSIK